MQKCASGGDPHQDIGDKDDDDCCNDMMMAIISILIILIRAKELETVLNNEEQGMVVPITRWIISQ